MYLIKSSRLVGDALPNLRRISEQDAASTRAPAQDPLYGGRDDEEAAILARLQWGKCLVLSGFGGIGKTEIACSVAHRLRDNYELVIWIDWDRLDGPESLRAFDVRLNRCKLNILHLLASHKTLLAQDNIRVDLNTDALAAICGPQSRVVITSQVEFGANVVPVGFVSRKRASEILSDGVREPCPDSVLDAVLQGVEGHPLVLRMLNRLAIQGHDWAAVETLAACQRDARGVRNNTDIAEDAGIGALGGAALGAVGGAISEAPGLGAGVGALAGGVGGGGYKEIETENREERIVKNYMHSRGFTVLG